jgi:Domain of unknown function (DU1801)
MADEANASNYLLNCLGSRATMESIEEQIESHLISLPAPQQQEMRLLHQQIQNLLMPCQLWYMDGRNEENKVVTNPNIGYGNYVFHYADGTSRSFYKFGISAKKSGISVYFMGLEDKKFLSEALQDTIGKAKVTGYCVQFKSLKDIHLDVLLATMKACAIQ